MKKTLCLLLALTLALASLCVPALGEEYFNSRTKLSGSSASKRNNIELAIASIDGLTLAYGDSFSFNDIVGPRSKEAGYEEARNGRGVNVRGGGVAQVATTLYLALRKIGGVVFDDFHTYGDSYNDNYVASGDLAIVTDYSAGTDFSFTNYADELYFEMWTTDSYLYCSVRVGTVKSGPISWVWGDEETKSGSMIASAFIELDEDEDLINNITLASDSATDTTLDPGDVFSFNDIIGPRDKEHGYLYATNGRGVSVRGGGVAQVASVIWLAIKDLEDIKIIEKQTYGERYNQHYVEKAEDAIVTDYSADIDFSFRYKGGESSITLYIYLDDGFLYCDIYRND